MAWHKVVRLLCSRIFRSVYSIPHSVFPCSHKVRREGNPEFATSSNSFVAPLARQTFQRHHNSTTNQSNTSYPPSNRTPQPSTNHSHTFPSLTSTSIAPFHVPNPPPRTEPSHTEPQTINRASQMISYHPPLPQTPHAKARILYPLQTLQYIRQTPPFHYVTLLFSPTQEINTTPLPPVSLIYYYPRD